MIPPSRSVRRRRWSPSLGAGAAVLTVAASLAVAAPAATAAGPVDRAATPRAAKKAKKAKARKGPLTISVSGVPKRLAPNRAYRATVRVKNASRKTVKHVRLQVGRVKGVSIRRHGKASWSSLKPRKTGRVTLRLQTSAKAKAKAKLKLRATGAGKVRATKTVTLHAAGPLVGKYFWGFQTHVDYAWDTRGVYFVDDRWAYRGLPTGGLPTCTKQTATLDDQGQPTGDGCFPFRYDAKTGQLTVGPYTGSYADGKLKFEDLAMYELAIPEAGARYQVALEHQGFSGMCGLLFGCTTWHYSLGLNADGQFVDSSSSLSTMGGVGTPFIAAGNYPPDEYGTYQILSGGRLQLTYADGTVKTKTIGVELGDAGQPDPVHEGLVVDDRNYYPPSD